MFGFINIESHMDKLIKIERTSMLLLKSATQIFICTNEKLVVDF